MQKEAFENPGIMATTYLANMREMLNEKTTSYLNSINYRNLLQLLVSEYLIAVSEARQERNEERLVELEDVAQFMLDLLKDKMDRRDSQRTPTTTDLQDASWAKMEAFDKSSETKWNKRPTSSYQAQRSAFVTDVNEDGEIARPDTAPPGVTVHEMRSAREMAKQYKSDYSAMQKKVEELLKKKKALEAKVKEEFG